MNIVSMKYMLTGHERLFLFGDWVTHHMPGIAVFVNFVFLFGDSTIQPRITPNVDNIYSKTLHFCKIILPLLAA